MKAHEMVSLRRYCPDQVIWGRLTLSASQPFGSLFHLANLSLSKPPTVVQVGPKVPPERFVRRLALSRVREAKRATSLTATRHRSRRSLRVLPPSRRYGIGDAHHLWLGTSCFGGGDS